MPESVLGYKTCPTCQSIMYEHIDDRGDDYYICTMCETKIRIFHKPIRPQERPFAGTGIA